MTPDSIRGAGGLLLASIFLTGAFRLPAQTPSLPSIGKVQPLSYATKTYANDQKTSVLVEEKLVRFPGASFLQIGFKDIRLGEGSTLEVISLLDDEKQVWTAGILAEQGREALESLYFNGDAVLIRLWAGPRSEGNRFAIANVGVGNQSPPSAPQTICGTDNRTRWTDGRVARILIKKGTSIGVCTAWLISPVNCLATAGHCLAGTPTNVTVEFNVPLSTASGAIVHPPTSHQYTWMGTSNRLFENNGIGKDWGVFTTNKNPQTQRYPASVQRTWFLFWSVPALNTTLRVTGHGADTTPRTLNFVQQTDTGRLVQIGASFLRYRVDTMGGNSGSPVMIASTQRAIGVHTHGGCTFSGGSNAGTRADYSPFATARTRLCTRRPMPDFRAVGISSSVSTLRAKVAATVSAGIQNVGTATAPTATHGVYVSVNQFISTADLLVHSYVSPALSVGAIHNHVASVTMPANLPNGTCYLGLLADRTSAVAEESEGNNTATRRVTCIGLPDLTVVSMLPSTTVLTPNKLFSIRSTIKNAGKGPAASFASGYYLSLDNRITTADALLGSFTISALAASATKTILLSVRAPSTLRNGTCYLGTYADRLFQVSEINETNNTRAVLAKCSRPTPRPDLIVSSFRPQTTVWTAGSQVSGFATVKNIGTATAVSSVTGIYLSPDSVISITDRLLAGFATPSLAANAIRVFSFRVTIPTSTRSGTCYLGALADIRRNVFESNELNNYRSVLGRCVSAPDLIISSVLASRTAIAGGLAIVTSTTRNLGGATAASSLTGLYLSANNLITTADTFLGGYATGTLAAGASKSVSARLRLPFCTAGGRYFFGAIADNGGVVREASEANNWRSAPLSTSVAPYAGTQRLVEYRPHWGSPATSTTLATFSARRGGTVSMCVTAPQFRSHWYLLLWSGGATTFRLDAFTKFQLGLVNSPIFPLWFGRTSATTGMAFPRFFLPRVSLSQGFDVYTYSLWFDPTLRRVLGFGSNHIRTRINP